MLVPQMKIVEIKCRYCVFDTEKGDWVINKVFTDYATKQECQNEIDYYNQFKVVKEK